MIYWVGGFISSFPFLIVEGEYMSTEKGLIDDVTKYANQDNKEAHKFAEIPNIKDEFDLLRGNTEQVLTYASFLNMGKAIAENDLYGPGEYKLHEIPGIGVAFVVKHNKQDYTFVMKVFKYAEEEYKKSLAKKKAKSDAAPEDSKMVYDVPKWVMFELVMNLGVHPFIDEKEFEQALWDYYPRLWLDEKRAPKRMITK